MTLARLLTHTRGFWTGDHGLRLSHLHVGAHHAMELSIASDGVLRNACETHEPVCLASASRYAGFVPSSSRKRWVVEHLPKLDEIEVAHAGVGGEGPGRRYATQQVNHAYAVLLASRFQAFCRDLHSEVTDHMANATPAGVLRDVLRARLLENRQLDRVNAQPSSIGSDFNRFGLDIWQSLYVLHERNRERNHRVERLNAWRNAIAHQDFSQVAGHTLGLRDVRTFRSACSGLVKGMDEVMCRHLRTVAGRNPW